MAVRNVKIDGAGLTVIPSTKGSILYVGDFGLLHEDNANLAWDEANLALKVNKWSVGNGGILFVNDNVANIGAAGASRPHIVYVAADVIVGEPSLQIQLNSGGGALHFGNSPGNANIDIGMLGGSADPTAYLYNRANAGFVFGTNNISRWQFTNDGNFVATTDNALDIGLSGANRPRTGYFGTLVSSAGTGVGFSSTGATTNARSIQLANTGGSVYLGVETSVNGGFFTGALAYETVIYSLGNDTRILTPNLFVGAPPQFKVANTANAVNYIQVSGGATGFRPTISAAGSDAAVGMEFQVQGASDFNFFTGGFRQLLIGYTGSANRYITLTGSNGGNPTIDVSAGALKLSAGTSDIQWGKANVALGGGAAPTVGTIGGSGPAAAAQRNWLRFLESDGTASFIPVWR